MYDFLKKHIRVFSKGTRPDICRSYRYPHTRTPRRGRGLTTTAFSAQQYADVAARRDGFFLIDRYR